MLKRIERRLVQHGGLHILGLHLRLSLLGVMPHQHDETRHNTIIAVQVAGYSYIAESCPTLWKFARTVSTKLLLESLAATNKDHQRTIKVHNTIRHKTEASSTFDQ
jgi:hypothetical protein